MARADLVGWASRQRIAADGAVESEQRVAVDRPVVEPSEEGAKRLASRYWAELRRSGRGLLSVREHPGGIDVRVLGAGPLVLTLGPIETELSPTSTAAAHPILGGLLVRRSGGCISFEQAVGERVELRSRITGFYPRRGLFYGLVQRRLHLAVSRRYFRRLIGGDRP
jgi:hypothetical protein